jgi:hypothetical protein
MTERATLSYDALKDEAERQGLDLSEDDLEAIHSKLSKTKALLATQRPLKTARLEPAYTFRPDHES